jgi:hypothetical protein
MNSTRVRVAFLGVAAIGLVVVGCAARGVPDDEPDDSEGPTGSVREAVKKKCKPHKKHDAGCDASPDGGVDAAPPPPPFCSTQPATTLACDDFDQAGSVVTGCTLDSTTFVSAPFSCATGAPIGPNFRLSGTATNPSVSFDADFRIETVPTAQFEWVHVNSSATPRQCPVGTTSCTIQLVFLIDTAGHLVLSLRNPQFPPANIDLGAAPLAQWNHVKVVSSHHVLDVFVNGAHTIANGGTTANIVAGPRSVDLGVIGTGNPLVRFDNLLLGNP